MTPKTIASFAQAESYPSMPRESHPWVAAPAGSFTSADEGCFFYLDFHWPRGVTPMTSLYLHDCYSWGTQVAAARLPLPLGNGLMARLAGTHVYASPLALGSRIEAAWRGQRLEAQLPHFLANFHQIWQGLVKEMDAGFSWFLDAHSGEKALNELCDLLLAARAYQRRCWEIHFEVMYPLIAAYLNLRGFCLAKGLAADRVPLLLQGYDNKIMACDRELWLLADAARAQGLESIFANTPPSVLMAQLADTPEAVAWLERFAAFLSEYGWRTEGIADVYLAPWIEDPTPALGTVKTILLSPCEHNFEEKRQKAIEEREREIARVRATLSGDDKQCFEELFTICREANFSWWNDEHNHYIDLRASIPLRNVCLALGRHFAAERPEDVIFLFWDEAHQLARGEKPWAAFTEVVRERRIYHDEWLIRRGEMPPVLGNIPETIEDPIMIEIFGLSRDYLGALASAERTEVKGMGVSAGVARGRAVVMRDAGKLHEVEPGEILVCEATTPNWTPAFTKIAACVCDVGGSLTHAAIVAREYRIPCIVGTATGTAVIRTGDFIEVDGDAGIVRVLEPATVCAD